MELVTDKWCVGFSLVIKYLHLFVACLYTLIRAAAYTQIQMYTEAIIDCLKSIDINPNYSKAYSRLGLAYYAQGNYSDAISRGFMKGIYLLNFNDPN